LPSRYSFHLAMALFPFDDRHSLIAYFDYYENLQRGFYRSRSGILAMALIAQVARDLAPLKNWPAPLCWQLPNAEDNAAAQLRAAALAPRAQSPVNSPVFVAFTSCRAVDTRASQNFAAPFGTPSLAPGPARSYRGVHSLGVYRAAEFSAKFCSRSRFPI
jgi:hypothetical protein